MEIFDCHTHIYPPAIAEKAVKSVGDFYAINMSLGGISDELIRISKPSGITRHVVCSVAVVPKHVRNINNFIADQCSEHPEFVGLGTVHADDNDILGEVERITSLGLKGLKIHPDTQLFNIDDERMFPVYEAISGKMPILIHTGDYRYDYSHPRRLKRILDLFPQLTVIAAHFGGWSLADIAFDYLKNTNCFVDTSSSIACCVGKRRALELIRLYGADRVLFGTDFPMWNPADEFGAFCDLGLTQEEERLILSENPCRVFGVQ